MCVCALALSWILKSGVRRYCRALHVMERKARPKGENDNLLAPLDTAGVGTPTPKQPVPALVLADTAIAWVKTQVRCSI